jgi:uncharacterized cupredoxin-like copper-binding protein
MSRWIKYLAALSFFGAGAALAHGDKAHAEPTKVIKEQKAWGIAGDAKAATRTIAIGMDDSMRFSVDKLEFKQGDTVRFKIANNGKLMHEFVIGTKAENKKHAEYMLKFPDMEHDEPYMAHVSPGKLGEIVWKFNRAGEFEFACLMAGHYQTGMVGKIKVKAK